MNKFINKCPECGSINTDTFRMPTGPIWCRDCGYRVEDKENGNPFYISQFDLVSEKVKEEPEDTLLEKIDSWLWDHLPHWLCRIPTRIKDFNYEIKYFFQKAFREHHSSDKELWNLYGYIIKFIYPKLLAFQKMERCGYPSAFCNFEDNMGFESQEQYDESVAKGEMTGGGPEAWEKVLDEMIFACEYTLHDEYDKKYKFFYKKWSLEDPHAKKKENESKSFIDGKPFYFNVKLEMEYSKRAQKGIELLGKHMMSLWD